MSIVVSNIYPPLSPFFFFFNDTATTEIYTLSLHDALPIWPRGGRRHHVRGLQGHARDVRAPLLHRGHAGAVPAVVRSEEHTSELQSRLHLVCRLLLEKKKKYIDKSSSDTDCAYCLPNYTRS